MDRSDDDQGSRIGRDPGASLCSPSQGRPHRGPHSTAGRPAPRAVHSQRNNSRWLAQASPQPRSLDHSCIAVARSATIAAEAESSFCAFWKAVRASSSLLSIISQLPRARVGPLYTASQDVARADPSAGRVSQADWRPHRKAGVASPPRVFPPARSRSHDEPPALCAVTDRHRVSSYTRGERQGGESETAFPAAASATGERICSGDGLARSEEESITTAPVHSSSPCRLPTSIVASHLCRTVNGPFVLDVRRIFQARRPSSQAQPPYEIRPEHLAPLARRAPYRPRPRVRLRGLQRRLGNAPADLGVFHVFYDLASRRPCVTRSARKGYDLPTPVQTQSIPLVLSGTDLLARAQTGTGKTAAFGLPMIERLLLRSTRRPRRVPRAGWCSSPPASWHFKSSGRSRPTGHRCGCA